MEVDFSGSYTNAENCKEGDIGIVIGEGAMEEKESFKGRIYMQPNIDVEINGKKLVHSIGINEGRVLVDKWGRETKTWLNKRFVCHLVRYMSQGQTKQKIEIEPIEQKA